MALLSCSLALNIAKRPLALEWNSVIRAENREPEQKPRLRSLPPKKWGAALDAFYNDKLPYRAEIITFYRRVLLEFLRTGVAREIPGLDGWVFRRGGDWAELDDYLGALEFTPEELEGWVMFFEGRKEWAEAHGTKFMQLLLSAKAHIHSEKIFPAISSHKGATLAEQLRQRLEASPAKDNVVFSHELFLNEKNNGALFYAADHHINARGVWLAYSLIADKLRQWHGRGGVMPFGSPECREANERLEVAHPRQEIFSDAISVFGASSRYPQKSLAVRNAASTNGLRIVIGHDSMMRYGLASWRGDEASFRLPFDDSIAEVYSMMWMRFASGRLDYIISSQIPDAIIEEIADCKLAVDRVGDDKTFRRAAEFARAAETADASAIAAPPAGAPLLVRAVLENVTDETGEIKAAVLGDKRSEMPITVELLQGGVRVASQNIVPGVRRAIWFAQFASDGRPLSLRIANGKCASSALAVRLKSSPQSPVPSP